MFLLRYPVEKTLTRIHRAEFYESEGGAWYGTHANKLRNLTISGTIFLFGLLSFEFQSK